MLRLMIVLALVANLGFWAWERGHLASWGWAPVRQSEPERLQRQVQPQALELVSQASAHAEAGEEEVQVLSASADLSELGQTLEVTAIEADADLDFSVAPKQVCRQAGPFDARELNHLRSALTVFAPQDWDLQVRRQTERWMVYLGPLVDQEQAQTRREALRDAGYDVDRPAPEFEPGISLGRFSNKEGAHRAMTDLSSSGLTPLHVMLEQPGEQTATLRLPHADSQLLQRVRELPVMAGHALRACD